MVERVWTHDWELGDSVFASLNSDKIWLFESVFKLFLNKQNNIFWFSEKKLKNLILGHNLI